MYKNFIFDFGNVLFDLDLSQIEKKLSIAYGKNGEKARENLYAANVFELYETGGLSTDEFLEHLRLAGGKALEKQVVEDAWNSIFLQLPFHRLEMLLELRKKYRVFLLSNINDLHEKWIREYLIRTYQITDFETRFFDGVYYSHLIRLRKPYRQIYEYLLTDAELIPEECIFFDDLPENIAAANTLKIKGVHHKPEEEILDKIKPFLI